MTLGPAGSRRRSATYSVASESAGSLRRSSSSRPGVRPCCDSEGTDRTQSSSSLLRAAKMLVGTTVDEVQSLRLARENELTAIITEGPLDESCSEVGIVDSENTNKVTQRQYTPAELHVGSPLWLRLCGFLLQRHRAKRLYRYTMLSIALAIVGLNIVRATTMSGDAEFQFEVLSNLILAVGSVLGILCCKGLCAGNILGCPDSMMVTYARRQAVVQQWSQVTKCQNGMVLVLWVGSVLCRCFALSHLLLVDRQRGLAVVTYMLSSFLF